MELRAEDGVELTQQPEFHPAFGTMTQMVEQGLRFRSAVFLQKKVQEPVVGGAGAFSPGGVFVNQN